MILKRIIWEKYKIMNIGLALMFFVLFLFVKANYGTWFSGNDDIVYIYKYYDGIYKPVLVGLTWLTGILAALLVLPSQIFRKWLFYIAPVFLFLTFVIVQGISVYSSNLLNPTRAQMVENCMIVLSVITVLFVVYQLVSIWRKGKTSN